MTLILFFSFLPGCMIRMSSLRYGIMSAEISSVFVPVVVALISGGLGAFITGWFMRQKTQAEAESSLARAAMNVMTTTLDNALTPLNERIDNLEEENEGLSQAIENLNGKFLKLQLAFVIISRQLEQLGERPLITFDELERTEVEDLRAIAKSMDKITREPGG